MTLNYEMGQIDNPHKTPYKYQERDIETIVQRITQNGAGYCLLYQLPTGGGKTVIFSEIARRFMETFGKSVAILTHRNELCRQTSRTLRAAGVRNRILNSKSQVVRRDRGCYVAMVETLKNRIRDGKVQTDDVALVIVDEAHHNSFRKLLQGFPNATILGVTATPLSSDANLPLNQSYNELITGESINSLISARYLARPKTVSYEVDLQTLSRGNSGDYTIGSSDALYSMPTMLQLLYQAYDAHSRNKKTLIFNAGIAGSKSVEAFFRAKGFAVRHLDNRTPEAERAEILKWFRKTRNAILTSVSLLTTGFDEPGVQTVILNRATTSLTLFHQMVGRGARISGSKKSFTIIDLGNNIDRFGHWEDPIDWKAIYDHPEDFISRLQEGIHQKRTSGMGAEARSRFANTADIGFDLEKAFDAGNPKKKIIQASIRQHLRMCLENASSTSEALELARVLLPDIDFRLRTYVRLMGKTTASYRKWLNEDYVRRLEGMIRRTFVKVHFDTMTGDAA